MATKRMTETHPIVFGTRTELCGMLELPGSMTESSGGIVVCAPLLHQNITSYRPLRTLARRLADGGRPVLRFDWPGCGDSADPAELGLSAWTGAVSDAVAALRELTGVHEVSLVGLRIGATLGMAAAVTEPAISELVLLAPFPSGRAYLRELTAFESLSGASVEPAGAGALPEGSIEASGFLLMPEDVSALDGLDLSSLDLRPLAGRRALIATVRPDRSVAALSAQLTDSGLAVTEVVEGGLSMMLEGTNDAVLPRSCADLVVGWLGSGADGPSTARAPRPVAQARTSLAVGVGATHEEAVVMHTDRGRLVGVTCEPTRGSTDDAWVVFLNAAKVRRVGPNRLWTTYARHWAERGVRSFRFDGHGVGDSDGDATIDEVGESELAQYYQPGFVADTLDALAWLAQAKGAGRFALVGLCSGATRAFSAALEDERIASVALVNPRTLFWDDHAQSLAAWSEARQIARDPRTWHSVLRRGVRTWGADAARGGALALRGKGDDTWHRREILSSFGRLATRGATTLCVFSAGDTGVAYFKRHLGPDFASALAAEGVEVEVIEGPDHTFRPLWSHDVLRRVLERPLTRSGFL